MPFADFTLLFSDAEIVDSFTVLRRASGEDSHGRSNPTVVRIFENCYGVVTFANPSDLAYTSDQVHQQKTISIATPFQLQGPVAGQDPDIVRWHGDDFLVTSVNDATAFGPGWVHSLAQRLDANVPLLVSPR